MAKTKIPQGVTKEDKLVGPLTLKQFLYTLAGASIIFIAYQYYALQYLYFLEFILISFVAGALAIALAFVKINGRVFSIFLGNLARFIFVPKKRSWYKEPEHILPKLKIKSQDVKDTKSEVKERKSGEQFKMQIEKLANILDAGGTMSTNTGDAITNQITNIAESSLSINEDRLGVEDILEATE